MAVKNPSNIGRDGSNPAGTANNTQVAEQPNKTDRNGSSLAGTANNTQAAEQPNKAGRDDSSPVMTANNTQAVEPPNKTGRNGSSPVGTANSVWEKRIDDAKKAWYKFSKNKLSVVGLCVVAVVMLLALFAPFVTPHPAHAGAYTDFINSCVGPGAKFLLGSDNMGRDILTRIIFSFRGALYMAILVLAIAVPVGSFLGLMAGYMKNTWIDHLIMRITDVFLSVPALLLALAVASILEANLTNAMIAITVMWWPWYARLMYGMASSCRNEYYVVNAELTGASKGHIIFREILPNCLSPIFTKMALDVGWVILIGATLSYVGLGEQPPTPSLGQMVSDGSRYMPDAWWMTIFPSLAIVIIILGFNFLGDGISDMLSKGDSKYE